MTSIDTSNSNAITNDGDVSSQLTNGSVVESGIPKYTCGTERVTIEELMRRLRAQRNFNGHVYEKKAWQVVQDLRLKLEQAKQGPIDRSAGADNFKAVKDQHDLVVLEHNERREQDEFSFLSNMMTWVGLQKHAKIIDGCVHYYSRKKAYKFVPVEDLETYASAWILDRLEQKKDATFNDFVKYMEDTTTLKEDVLAVFRADWVPDDSKKRAARSTITETTAAPVSKKSRRDAAKEQGQNITK